MVHPMPKLAWAGSTVISAGGTLTELVAAFVVVFHAGWAVGVLVRSHDSDQARLIIGDGVLAALSFSVAGTLLKTIGLESWEQIRIFAFVLALRTLLKQVFQWEQRTLGHRAEARRAQGRTRRINDVG